MKRRIGGGFFRELLKVFLMIIIIIKNTEAKLLMNNKYIKSRMKKTKRNFNE
jgi:hypothetical protein